MTLGEFILYCLQAIILINFVIAYSISRVKKAFNDYFRFSVFLLAIILLVYLFIGSYYLAENWDKVIF